MECVNTAESRYDLPKQWFLVEDNSRLGSGMDTYQGLKFSSYQNGGGPKPRGIGDDPRAPWAL
jgi:hypothetical protein